MSASIACVTEQLEKLSGLDGYPRGDVARGAMAQAFLESFPSDRQLSAWVDDWLRREPRAPKPSQIREGRQGGDDPYTGAIQKQVTARREADPNCATCSGYGQVYAWHLVTYENGRKKGIERITIEQHADIGTKINKATQRVYELPVPCGCRGTA